jgi:hypothetical protein
MPFVLSGSVDLRLLREEERRAGMVGSMMPEVFFFFWGVAMFPFCFFPYHFQGAWSFYITDEVLRYEWVRS